MSWYTHRIASARRRGQRPFRLGLESLEPRVVLDAGLMADLSMQLALPWTVPALESHPGAEATLYLDFNGHFEEMWGYDTLPLGDGRWDDVVTPAFDLDGDPGTFNAEERDWIEEVFLTVAEDYAPFDINVTTIAPRSFHDGEALRVAIGGSNSDWFVGRGAGVAYVGSFTSDVVNTVYVFAEELDSARDIGDCSSHEAGHAFGLYHQSEFDAAGNMVQEYGHASPDKAPIMGHHYDSTRATWWIGDAQDDETDPIFEQDDMTVIASSTNGFGYRSDDHSNYRSYATPLHTGSSGAMEQQVGIVAQTYDDDWFSFMTGDGRVNFQVRVADVNPNLDVKLELWREVTGYGGRTYVEQVCVEDPRFMLSANMSCVVTAGKYYLLVTSHGEYGDAGQYTLNGEFPQYYLPAHDIGFAEGIFLKPEALPQPYVTEPWFQKTETRLVEKPEYLDAGLDLKEIDLAEMKTTEMAAANMSQLKAVESYRQAVDLAMATDLTMWWETEGRM